MDESSSNCIIALTYSNIPRMRTNVPGIVLGLLTNSYLENQLQQIDFNKKESMIRKENSLLRLESVASELSEYVVDSEMITISDERWSPEAVQLAYNEIMRRLTQGTLSQFQVPKIYVRTILGWGFSENRVPPDFPKNAKVEFCSRRNPNKFFQLSRIVARLQYEKQRKIDPTIIYDRIRSQKSPCLQILRVLWNSPDIEQFNGSSVGPPNILVRKAGQRVAQPIPVKLGAAVNVSPIAKLCIGWEEDETFQDCLSLKGESNLMGALLLNSMYERCFPCSEKSKHLRCTYRRPTCDGFKVSCHNYGFAGGFCLGEHALYITRFGNTLKIGTAYLTNVVGRLLEQGAGKALVLWPVAGVKVASDMELALTRFLGDYYSKSHEDGVLNVVFAGPPATDRLNSFMKDWDDKSDAFLKGLKDMIFSTPIPFKSRVVELREVSLNSNLVDLVECYTKPDATEDDSYRTSKVGRKKILQYDRIEGHINGYRGHFAFLAEDDVVDFRALQGYVVEGDFGVV